MKSMLILLSTFILLTGFTPLPKENNRYDGIPLYETSNDNFLHDNSNNLYTIDENGVIEPYALTGVALFAIGLLAGLAFAWVVDGYLIYRTGYSGAEWVARGMAALDDLLNGLWRNAKGLHINPNTNKVSYATNSSGCVSFDPKGLTYVCPMTNPY